MPIFLVVMIYKNDAGVNLVFSLVTLTDIRELIQVDDVMEDESLRFGPNGGLVFCMEYFANNFDWLEESLGHVEDDYILFDCPGSSCCVSERDEP